ncbi:hypothetical protein PVAND_013786 [Polypedilum vanderplanki]|uniref:Protein quiver n=1 Tax=Polypedilum vanderplanki TaxID=319348 RepID=A0A9J6CQS1_POLVA|nr:hypothetical protein PVAND_013786 [Polypedilum vanderplanki]
MREKFLIIVILVLVDFSSCLKCYKTGFPWPKECSPVIYEKYGARPACLWAIIIDQYNNPVEIQRCAKIGDSHLGACDILRKKEITCPGLPEGVKNESGMQELCYKTFAKQRTIPRSLITRGCVMKMNSSHDVCNDLTKQLTGRRIKCFLCDSHMCNSVDQNEKFITIFIAIILVVIFIVNIS